MSKTMKSTGIIVGIAAMGLVDDHAFAQQGPGFGPGQMGKGPDMMMKGMGPGGMGHGPTMGNFADPGGRLATLKTELGIKADQIAAWDAYVNVVIGTTAEHREHAQRMDRNAMRNMKPEERQQQLSSMQAARGRASQGQGCCRGTSRDARRHIEGQRPALPFPASRLQDTACASA